jgi:hypothetical protein
MYKKQSSFYDTLTKQTTDEYGNAVHVFNDLLQAFQPIVAAGPNQEGYTPAQKADLISKAVTDAGNSYRTASTAARQAQAAVGGGNMALPGGAAIGTNLAIANSAAQLEANSKQRIREDSLNLGRQNFFAAAPILSGSTDVFNPVTGMAQAANSGGQAASDTANQIAAANNSWVNATIGALGGIAGSFASGGMANLGKGQGFFGGK